MLDDLNGPALFRQRAPTLGAADVDKIVPPSVAEASSEQLGFGRRRIKIVLRFAERVSRCVRTHHEIAQRAEQEARTAGIALHDRDGRQRECDQRAIQPGVDRRIQRCGVAVQEGGLAAGDQQDFCVGTIPQHVQCLQKLIDHRRCQHVLADRQRIDAITQRVQIDAGRRQFRGDIRLRRMQHNHGPDDGHGTDGIAAVDHCAQRDRAGFFGRTGRAHGRRRRAQERDLPAGFRQYRCRKPRFGDRMRGGNLCGDNRRGDDACGRARTCVCRCAVGGGHINRNRIAPTQLTQQTQAADLHSGMAQRVVAGHIPTRGIGIGGPAVFAAQDQITLCLASALKLDCVDAADLPIERR